MSYPPPQSVRDPADARPAGRVGGGHRHQGDEGSGLDLKGGVELVYQGEPTPQSEVTPEAIDRAIDIIRERVDRLGVAEPEIQRLGNDQISVGLPGVKNLDRAKKQVGTTAQLYLYDWERNVVGSPTPPLNASTRR